MNDKSDRIQDKKDQQANKDKPSELNEEELKDVVGGAIKSGPKPPVVIGPEVPNV